jgi:arylsulfatase A-like enzyme
MCDRHRQRRPLRRSRLAQKRGELGLPVEETSIAAMLKPLGYDTACIGKWLLGYEPKFSPNRHRFDHFFGIMGGLADYFSHVEPGGQPTLYENGKPISRSGYLTDLLAEESVAWLRRRSSTPFFLFVPFNAPHDPMQGPDDRAKPLTAETWNRGDRATYVKMVERMDAAVGEILEQLRKMGAVENTLVAFLSDNGGQRLARNLPLRGGKSSVYEGGLRVPGIVRWPGVAPEGATSRQVAITMDLTPTFLKAAGGSGPRPLDGVDLTAWIKVPSTSVPRTLFWRYKRGTTVRKAVRDGDLKLTNDDGREELFDLSKDPEEKSNLLAARPESAQRLKSKLSEWEERVRAPRLRPFEQRAARSETR